MPIFVLEHNHAAHDCAVAFAAWHGHPSPLRHGTALGSCGSGGHRLWFVVRAADERAALAQLPPWVAARTRAHPVDELALP